MEGEPLRVWPGRLPDVDLRDRNIRMGLNPIVRAALDRRFAPADAADRYGSLLSRYELCGPDEAEVATLPFVIGSSSTVHLTRFVDQAERRGLRTLVFAGNDIEPLIPSASVILLHPGPTRGAQPKADVLALPYLLTDRAHGVTDRPVSDRPSVAFCGQGASRRLAAASQFLARVALSTRNQLQPTVVPPPIRGHVGLRRKALSHLGAHREVDDRFIIRNRYRAGVISDADRDRTERQFDENLRSATYALCVRGTGNFSARFYEALSFGRIPLFVDTDCVLPFEDEIDWSHRCVWLDRRDVRDIGERLVAEHRNGASEGDRGTGALRRLWEDRLSQNGYFGHLISSVRRLL